MPMTAIEREEVEKVIKDMPNEKLEEAYRLMKWLQAPEDQKWFWEKDWYYGEKEATEDIKAGRVKSFDNLDDLFADLDSDETEEWVNEETK